jgi:hypothetical protein
MNSEQQMDAFPIGNDPESSYQVRRGGKRLKKIDRLEGAGFRWQNIGAFRMEYELRKDRIGPLATLSFRSVCGSLAFAACAGGRWSFKRVGFLKPRITVRLRRYHQDLAVYHPSVWSGGGALTTSVGANFRIRTEFWERELEVRGVNSETLIRMSSNQFFSSGGDLEIMEAAADLPELPWLVCFIWYLALIMSMDSAAASAACCASLYT